MTARETEYKRQWRARRREQGLPTSPPVTKHGTTTSYRYGCRCPLCSEAMNVYQRKRNGGTAPKNPGKYNVIKSTNGGNHERNHSSV